jgi:hypothetical protein
MLTPAASHCNDVAARPRFVTACEVELARRRRDLICQRPHSVVTGGVLPVTTRFSRFRHSAGSATSVVTRSGDEAF